MYSTRRGIFWNVTRYAHTLWQNLGLPTTDVRVAKPTLRLGQVLGMGATPNLPCLLSNPTLPPLFARQALHASGDLDGANTVLTELAKQYRTNNSFAKSLRSELKKVRVVMCCDTNAPSCDATQSVTRRCAWPSHGAPGATSAESSRCITRSQVCQSIRGGAGQ